MCNFLNYVFIFFSALIDHLRPGTSPNWRELHAKNAYVNVIHLSYQFPECLLIKSSREYSTSFVYSV